MMRRRPGSRTPITRPKRNSTPCSYCLTIFTAMRQQQNAQEEKDDEDDEGDDLNGHGVLDSRVDLTDPCGRPLLLTLLRVPARAR